MRHLLLFRTPIPAAQFFVILFYMKKDHLKYLAIGTIFWGFIFAIIAWLFLENAIPSVGVLIIIYIILTAFLVFAVQFYMGGFPLLSPKKYFFVPVAVWFVVAIWGSIEGYLLGVPFSLFGFIH